MIELTMMGKKVCVNLKHLYYFIDRVGGTRLLLKGDHQLDVEETYEQVKKLVEAE